MVAPSGAIVYCAVLKVTIRIRPIVLKTCEFIVSGEPEGKGRPRITKTGRAYTPAKTRQYEERIKQAAWAEMTKQRLRPTERRVSMVIIAYFEIPKSYTKAERLKCEAGVRIPTRVDLDNIAKAVLDGCNGIAYTDDRTVWHLTTFKRFCDVGQMPHVHVKIMWDDPDDT